MEVLVVASWNAPRGGLHEHVLAQARALLGAGHGCTVVCRPGSVQDRLRHAGAIVIDDDLRDEQRALEACNAAAYDLVHTHPGRAREIALHAARRRGVPLVLTLHGTRLDSLRTYAGDVDALVVVSEAIRDFVEASEAFPPERIVVIPNGVDPTVFHPRPPAAARAGALVEIVVATRFDRDKRFVAHVLAEAWRAQLTAAPQDRRWTIAGEGTVESLLPELEQLAREMQRRAGEPVVRFGGWMDAPTLADLFRACDVVIASGRGAAEAMACGTPTIALGSRGYVGIMDEERAWAGRYGNFGGLGEQEDEYPPGALTRDLDHLLGDAGAAARIGAYGARFAAELLAQQPMDDLLLRLYRSLPGTRRDGPTGNASPAPRAPIAKRVEELRQRAREAKAHAAALGRDQRRSADRIARLERHLGKVTSSRWWRLGSGLRRVRVRLRPSGRRR